ncbi:MAG: hypothetical protein IT247_04490 [Bacteroidia bacterium]|nr:hypothetical protein [Bacteroidia bacterium]
MKRILLLMMAATFVFACGTRKKSTTEGMTEVTGPFSAKKYQSDRRFFRATGSGESINLEAARSQAMLLAKQRLASAVQTQIKSVQEAYSSDRKAEAGTEFEQRFQNLTREVLNQIIVDVATIGDKTFQKTDKSYVAHIAIEARKKTTYKKLKEIAKQKTTLSDKDKKYIEEMIDSAIKDLDDGE